MDLAWVGGTLTDEVVQGLADHCHLLEHLSLGNCFAVSDVAIRRVIESCPRLQFVDLRDANITDASGGAVRPLFSFETNVFK